MASRGTRSSRVCGDEGIPCYQKNFSLFDVYGADEAFVTGSFGGVTPVTEVDGRMIGNGKLGSMTRHLGELYRGEIAAAVKAAKGEGTD